jgi:hypothetical protein
VATVLTEEATFEIDAIARPDTLLVPEDRLADITGWELNAEGLCRGDVCVPVRARPDVRADGLVDLRVVTELTRQPFAFEHDVAAAAIGTAVDTHAGEPAGGRVHDLVLADVDGTPFRWTQLGRKKKVLVTWASW